MNVAVERLPESQVVLDISTDEQEFEKALDRAYRKVVGQVRLPGFRPGKAPRRIIEQLMGREVLIEQADRDLLDPLYQQALEREGINPVSEPDVEIYQAEPLAFKVTVQVYPTIELGDYAGVRVEPRRVEIGDEQVDEALTRLQKAQSPWEEPAEPRPAREGDQVTLDIDITREGGEQYREPLRDGVFVLGESSLLPGLRDEIVGMSVGESRDVRLAFAEDDETAEADMRGKTLDYHVTLKGVKEQHPLPLDDDLAKRVSDGRVETIDGLRAELRKELLRTERQKARTEVGNEVVNAMAAAATFDTPAALVDRQVDSEIDELRNHLGQNHGQTLEDYLRLQGRTLEEQREQSRPEAARRLRNSLVLREIATREGVSVSGQDIDAEIDRLVGGGEDAERMRSIYSSGYVRNLLENDLFERKLMDRIIAIATEGRGAFEPPEEPEEAAGTTADDDAPVEVRVEVGDDAEAAAAQAALAAAGGDRPDDTPSAAPDDAPAGDVPGAESAGVLPAGRDVPIGTGEAAAATETVVPDDDGAASTASSPAPERSSEPA